MSMTRKQKRKMRIFRNKIRRELRWRPPKFTLIKDPSLEKEIAEAVKAKDHLKRARKKKNTNHG